MREGPWVAVHTKDAKHMAWVARRKDGADGSLLVGDYRVDVGVIDPDKANEMADWLAAALNGREEPLWRRLELFVIGLERREWALADFPADIVARLRRVFGAPEARGEGQPTAGRDADHNEGKS